ncbi:MAG: thiamine biosynthesis protein ThiS [Deltaproteobacteria bacterium]|jgi:sulfur carrier protein|nr:thiamine biosynthesis protein ThiS [Deltaproteobacteria bacterium]
MSGSQPDSTLNLTVNGEPRAIPAPCSIARLLASLDIDLSTGQRVAVAINRSVVVRSRYPEALLCEGDRVEILEAVGGG